MPVARAAGRQEAGGRVGGHDAPHDDAKAKHVRRRRGAPQLHHLQGWFSAPDGAAPRHPRDAVRGCWPPAHTHSAPCGARQSNGRATVGECAPLAPRKRACRRQSWTRASACGPAAWRGQSPAWGVSATHGGARCALSAQPGAAEGLLAPPSIGGRKAKRARRATVLSSGATPAILISSRSGAPVRPICPDHVPPRARTVSLACMVSAPSSLSSTLAGVRSAHGVRAQRAGVRVEVDGRSPCGKRGRRDCRVSPWKPSGVRRPAPSRPLQPAGRRRPRPQAAGAQQHFTAPRTSVDDAEHVQVLDAMSALTLAPTLAAACAHLRG